MLNLVCTPPHFKLLSALTWYGSLVCQTCKILVNLTTREVVKILPIIHIVLNWLILKLVPAVAHLEIPSFIICFSSLLRIDLSKRYYGFGVPLTVIGFFSSWYLLWIDYWLHQTVVCGFFSWYLLWIDLLLFIDLFAMRKHENSSFLHWFAPLISFILTLLLSFSEGTDVAAQLQSTCTCNRPAGNEFVDPTVR